MGTLLETARQRANAVAMSAAATLIGLQLIMPSVFDIVFGVLAIACVKIGTAFQK